MSEESKDKIENESHSKFAQPLSWKRGGVIAAIVFSVLFVFSKSESGKYVERRISHTVEFRARDFLNQNPTISPKLKIYTYDDRAVDFTKSLSPNPGQWKLLLEAMAKNKPKAIFIDAYFSNHGDEGLDEFLTFLKETDVPIITGSFLGEDKIEGKREMNLLDEPRYNLLNWVKRGRTSDHENGSLDSIDHIPDQMGFFYGPHRSLEKGFKNVGHIVYHNDHFGRIYPFIRSGRNRAVPHTSILLANEETSYFDKGELYLEDNLFPIDEDGFNLVNQIPWQTLEASSLSLKGSLERVMWHKGPLPLKKVQEGDVVVIMWYYTAHVDWVASPFGRIAGGFLQASAFNSILTGEYLSPFGFGGTFLLIGCLVGFFLAMKAQLLIFTLLLGICTFAWVILGVVSFSYGDTFFPWLYSAIGTSLVGSVVFIEKARLFAKRSEKITFAFTGILSEDRMKEIIKNPKSFAIEPTGRNVTIMFVDIVGYSVVAERMHPKSAFAQLKGLLDEVRDSVHQYGGVVDKALGDGLLCFFGYHYDGSRIIEDHATQAVDCGIDIQRKILDRNMKAAEAGQHQFPLRIGINSDYVFIGDIGDDKKPDFTIIGNGVNFAQRLEAACDMYHLMIGASTNDRVTSLMHTGFSIDQRFIKIKHHDGFVEAYQVDPFAYEQQRLNLAQESYRKQHGINRKDNRIPIQEDRTLPFFNEFCNGRVHNFSESGIGIILPKYIGKGVTMHAQIGEPESEIRLWTQINNLSPIIAEVRWGRPFGDNEYLHGLSLKNMNEKQLEAFYQTLREFNKTSNNLRAIRVDEGAA